MPRDVAPGIHRLPLPLLDNPLGTVNSYVTGGGDGVRLVDCGWNTPDAYAALAGGLATLGHGIQDIREILVTHIHPDHFGLAERLVNESGARELIPRREAVYIGARYEDAAALAARMEAWLRVNGAPLEEVHATAEASLWMLSLVGVRRPDVLLDGGEVLDWGEYHFKVIATPGHSAGLICLYDRAAQILISSDHVLERVSPHIGLHVQSPDDPVGDYLASLRRVRDLPVRVVLPGHGAPFHDLAGRVDAIVAHHDERLAEMLRALGGDAATAYTVAGRLTWRGSAQGWHALSPFQRRMAVTETVAHLEHLVIQGKLGKEHRDDLVLYHALP